MKKLVILSIAIILLAAATFAGLAYYNSFHKVTVTLSSDVKAALIYKINPEEGHNHEVHGDELQKLTASGELSLQNGSYFIIPEGEKVAKDEIAFTVKDEDTSVSVTPGYSKEYLASVLKTEQPAINEAIGEAFPAQMQSHTVEKGTIFKKGEWFGALLVSNNPNLDLRSQTDFYRIILNKVDGSWKIVGTPQLVLTTSEFKDVPDDILREVNKLAPTED
ncbi:MAG TPA: hypothetical protein VFZ62_02245 [Candidatus Saccharimonadales bacterium]